MKSGVAEIRLKEEHEDAGVRLVGCSNHFKYSNKKEPEREPEREREREIALFNINPITTLIERACGLFK